MRLLTALTLALLSSCSGSPNAPARSQGPEAVAGNPGEGSGGDRRLASERMRTGDDGPREFKTTAEVGGLPPEGVAATFDRASDKLGKCFHRGVARVEFIGGAVKFWVKVDSKGKFMHAHLEHSDLGDRKTEQCLLDQLMSYTWPTPVGGTVGVATFSMSFEPSPDAVVPEPWPESRVADSLAALREPLDECKSGMPGTFKAIVFVRRDVVEDPPEKDGGAPVARDVGRTITASATPPEEAAEMAVDCLVDVLTKAEWPPPGTRPAKLQLSL